MDSNMTLHIVDPDGTQLWYQNGIPNDGIQNKFTINKNFNIKDGF